MQDFKEIRKKIIKNLFFFIILILIFVKISGILENESMKNENMVQSRNKSIYNILKEPKQSIDTIVVGDSLSYSAVSPLEMWEKYGITSYVCGQSGQKIQETYHMLETTFKTQSPKLVIVETNVMFRGTSGLTSVKESLEAWGNQYISIFRNHDIWKSLIMDKEYPEENYKGFIFRSAVQPYSKGEYMKKTEEKARIPDVAVAYMEKIRKLCKENDAELLLLGVPSPANYNYRRHNSVNEYADKNSIAYLDLNLKSKELEMDWKTDSLDKGDHLNLLGAQKVTDYLGEYLEEQYKLPDCRGKASNAMWEKEAEKYRKKVEEHLKIMAKE